MTLPQTADNMLLAEAGEGTRVQLQSIVKSYSGNTVLHGVDLDICLLYTSPSPRDLTTSRMPSSA